MPDVAEMSRLIAGLLAGAAATACMMGWELSFYRRFGLEGCLDWEINQHMISRWNGKEPAANLIPGLVVHGAIGSAAGVCFAALARGASDVVLVAGAVGLGVALWLLLLPLRRLATGAGLLDGRLGDLPALISLAGHLIYGCVLGLVIACLSHV